jgi:hypothetical protein
METTPKRIKKTENNAKPIQKRIKVRLDADVVEWLRSSGECFHTRMNAIRRDAMLHTERKTAYGCLHHFAAPSKIPYEVGSFFLILLVYRLFLGYFCQRLY